MHTLQKELTAIVDYFPCIDVTEGDNEACSGASAELISVIVALNAGWSRRKLHY